MNRIIQTKLNVRFCVRDAAEIKIAARQLVGQPSMTTEGVLRTVLLFALTDETARASFRSFARYCEAEGFITPLQPLIDRPVLRRASLAAKGGA